MTEDNKHSHNIQKKLSQSLLLHRLKSTALLESSAHTGWEAGIQVNDIRIVFLNNIRLQQVPDFLLGLWVLLQHWWRGLPSCLFRKLNNGL